MSQSTRLILINEFSILELTFTDDYFHRRNKTQDDMVTSWREENSKFIWNEQIKSNDGDISSFSQDKSKFVWNKKANS